MKVDIETKRLHFIWDDSRMWAWVPHRYHYIYTWAKAELWVFPRVVASA